MLHLTTKNGKFYIDDIEVKASPIYLGIVVNVVAETNEGKIKVPLENLIHNLVCDGYKRGNNLFEANSYRYFIVDKQFNPEIIVADGIVPEQ